MSVPHPHILPLLRCPFQLSCIHYDLWVILLMDDSSKSPNLITEAVLVTYCFITYYPKTQRLGSTISISDLTQLSWVKNLVAA